MFRRKLRALKYENAESFNICSQTDYRRLVVWLEEQKICHYKIEDRKLLRQVDGPAWDAAFQGYLDDISCPIERDDTKAVCDWLLGFAVTLAYDDNIEKYQNVTAESVQKNVKSAPEVVQTNPLDNLDFECADFKAGVQSLAKLLKVTPHPDHLVTLRAVCSLVRDRVNFEAVKNLENKRQSTGKPFSLAESPLGFETNDYVLNEAAKILRLLYIHDLRDMQTKINEAIVAIQNITANPKTDTRLGKVGR